MIAGLMKSGVDFVAADMPLANRFTIHILAAVAEYEARLILGAHEGCIRGSEGSRPKIRQPQPHYASISDAARKAAVRAVREQAKARALDYLPLVCELRDRGETIHGIALQLTEMGIETPRKRLVWRDRMVARVFEYAGEQKPKSWVSRRPRVLRLSNHLELPTLPLA
jgi:hypothetical protein